jgi:hypothetical protein
MTLAIDRRDAIYRSERRATMAEMPRMAAQSIDRFAPAIELG